MGSPDLRNAGFPSEPSVSCLRSWAAFVASSARVSDLKVTVYTVYAGEKKVPVCQPLHCHLRWLKHLGYNYYNCSLNLRYPHKTLGRVTTLFNRSLQSMKVKIIPSLVQFYTLLMFWLTILFCLSINCLKIAEVAFKTVSFWLDPWTQWRCPPGPVSTVLCFSDLCSNVAISGKSSQNNLV